MKLSGFFFLFILVLQIAMAAFGYILEPMPKHYESNVKILKFNERPTNFQISVVLALIEHFSVITLPILLFIAFSPYNIILGIILIIFRIAKGSIQVYIEKDYWRLLNIAKRYSATIDTEKVSLLELYRSILKTKSSRFVYAMIGWSIGTFAFSIVLITSGLTPLFIGWLGIAASILIGFGNVIKLVKPNLKAYEVLSSIGGIVSILFELLIGGWLLFFS
jgi:hypothetical protein